ncbi:MAG: GFA family protein [Gammaproteobacteria bacterium]
MTMEGGCCCGEIRYQIEGGLVDARRCHCSKCRKIFGGTGSAYAEVRPGGFQWLSGEEQLTRFGDNKGWGIVFCSICGSTLCGVFEETVHGVTLGSVDGDPGVTIQRHVFVGSKAPWDIIPDDAPVFDANND